MLCQFEKVIFPRDATASVNGFMIAVYKPCGTVRDAAGRMLDNFKAVGYCLPTSNKVKYRMEGRWTKNAKHGLQYEVERYEEVITPSKEGIITYLASGQIRGIGKKTAEKIYDTFGLETLEILDKEPRKLLSVRGISEKKLKKIIDSYLANRGARDVIAFLAPHGVSPNRAVKLYREYGEETMDIVRNHPYRLCELAGIAFRTADKLAMSMGIDPRSPERVDEALMYTLTDAESKGHLCMEKHDFLRSCLKLLDTQGLNENMLAARAVKLIQDERLVTYGDSAFRSITARVESNLAYEIVKKLDGYVPPYDDLDNAIAAEERKLRFRLAPEQKEAIKMALTSKFCVITGGPGTGKTSVQKALLDLYRERFPSGKIACCAPTGKAARRMEHSTGIPASTVHHALGLLANEDGQYGDPETLDADLILVDEVSMLDVYLAEKLLKATPRNARLILVGDSDQLPSVGPGAVLKEIIGSGLVPVVKLDQVFRQKEGSRIAANAKLIRHGNLSLEYGPDFEFYDSTDLSVSADMIESIYLQEIAKYGVDNVVLLSPYTSGKGTYITTTKNRKNRVLYLNPTVLSVMREWKREQARYLLAQGYPREGYCFTRENGKVLNPQAPTSYLARFGKKYGIQNLHPHALRHTMATISIANGADIVSVSEKLGHSETSVTLDVYSHVNKKAQKRANQILSQALYTPQNESKMQA